MLKHQLAVEVPWFGPHQRGQAGDGSGLVELAGAVARLQHLGARDQRERPVLRHGMRRQGGGNIFGGD